MPFAPLPLSFIGFPKEPGPYRGWVPLKGRDLKETACGFHFHGREFKAFKCQPLPIGASIKDGTNCSRDRRDLVKVGDVNAAALAGTPMAKSVLERVDLPKTPGVPGHWAWRTGCGGRRVRHHSGLHGLQCPTRFEAERYRRPWNRCAHVQ